LKAKGIRTFAQLADSDETSLRAAVEAAGLKFAPSLPTWARQARYLADGDQVGFNEYTEYLVAGQDPSQERSDVDATADQTDDAASGDRTSAGRVKRGANGDDLQRIEGIGPKIASALRSAEIDTFEKLADATVDELRTAIENAGMSFAPSLVTWAEQSRYLANGDEEGFAALTDRLIAGRREEG
jgi:predicted flap endonuclease-1-like 5' DNA nuclease